MKFATAAVMAAFLCAPAMAQHDHGKLGKAGEFYSRWNRPDMRTLNGNRVRSCCNQNDCERSAIIRAGGLYYVRNHKMAPDRDVLIPDRMFEHNQPDPRESPDGFSHVCLDSSKAVLCAVLGSGQ